jgi:hypothetical protein
MKITSSTGGEWYVKSINHGKWDAATERCACPADAGEFYACRGPVSVEADSLEELYGAIEDAEEFYFGADEKPAAVYQLNPLPARFRR